MRNVYIIRRFIMSKGSGMGRKRVSSSLTKGLDQCDAASHGKQCGKAKEVTKGNKRWMSEEKDVNPFLVDKLLHDLDD
jgi:hypothetical protein